MTRRIDSCNGNGTRLGHCRGARRPSKGVMPRAHGVMGPGCQGCGVMGSILINWDFENELTSEIE